jgi:MinD-like ATPase involved in chromosome partitioning or flagellar assembly
VDVKNIVIADTDKDYIKPIEREFALGVPEDCVLEIITEGAYFDEYFSAPKHVDVLLVSEALYSEEISRHDIGNLIVLTETDNKFDVGAVDSVFKYTSTREILARALSSTSFTYDNTEQSRRNTGIVIFYSAAGGSGKTTAALGTCMHLVRNRKRVLYVDAEYIQTFHRYIKDETLIPSENLKSYEKMRTSIRNEGFDFLPPPPMALSSLDVGINAYTEFISKAAAEGEYDYIIVDTDSSFTSEKSNLISIADRVVITLIQDPYAVFKTNALLSSVNADTSAKCVFVCNSFRPDSENTIFTDLMQGRVIISAYIEHIDGIDGMDAEDLARIKGFGEIAMQIA